MTGVQTCALPICFPVTIGGVGVVRECVGLIRDIWEMCGEVWDEVIGENVCNSLFGINEGVKVYYNGIDGDEVVYWLIVEVDGVEWDDVDGEIIMV